MRFGGESSYTLVASVATRAAALERFQGQVRFGRLAIFTAATLATVLVTLHIPPFLSAGADLANPAQRLYAGNLWSQVQVSLVLLGCFLPWLCYALLWRGAARGALAVTAVALTGTSLATLLTAITLGAYAALPDSMGGVVGRIQGRTIELAGQGKTYYLALSDDQITSATSWLKPGVPVRMWVSPRGQVAALEPATADGG